MSENHIADADKKVTMSLNLALIILDRLNTTERIDVARDNLIEAVKVVSVAAKYRIPRKPIREKNYFGRFPDVEKCPECKTVFLNEAPHFCGNCGQALDLLKEGLQAYGGNKRII